ncbi:hypothetical protein [Microbaculum marinum]|uniref:DUF3618 domain-containing protein n=1 Tax=Microbaculum marinum TaxID=1764581 RepID=A0AAW9RPQ2_9HYPH
MTDAPSALARDAEVSRARLDLTIDRIEQRLTPLGLADEAVGLVRRSTYRPALEKGLSAARRNPLPVLLIAAGAGLFAWRLMNERNDGAARPRGRDGAASPNGFDGRGSPAPHNYEPPKTNQGDLI